MINVGVLGYGTVGSGVVEILKKNADLITQKSGKEINVKYVLDLREFEGDPVQSVLVHDFEIIKNDPEVNIVVETMGGLHPAYEFVKASLEAGKNVCTSNKALVEAFGPELIKIAREKNINFLFEAAVGGGIPIIRPIRDCLCQEDILEISGILNGTTNYILTEMTDKGAAFDDVLKDAQDKGYAEKDPTADVCGYDAARKIAILTSLSYGKTVKFEDVYTEGITEISAEDIVYAKKLDKKVKILGSAVKKDGGISISVMPYLLSKDHPLANIDGVYNSIMVVGNMLDDVVFTGQGAGKLPTASAVVADVVEAAKFLNENIYLEWEEEKLPLIPFEETKAQFFVRVKGNDFKASGFDVQNVPSEFEGETAFITSEITEKEFKAFKDSTEVINYIRLK
ncbi:MAG: homoserine dehydrogenase [Lachnospiraceae bacterium]|nr:homoserine dehydrogenase [Lachnospiraceae bacterium]